MTGRGFVDAGPVQLARAQRLSTDWAKRARPGRRGLGSVREQLGQRATGYITRSPGPVCGPLDCCVGKGFSPLGRKPSREPKVGQTDTSTHLGYVPFWIEPMRSLSV